MLGTHRSQIIIILHTIQLPDAFEYHGCVLIKDTRLREIEFSCPLGDDLELILHVEVVLCDLNVIIEGVEALYGLPDTHHHVQNEIPILMPKINRKVLSDTLLLDEPQGLLWGYR